MANRAYSPGVHSELIGTKPSTEFMTQFMLIIHKCEGGKPLEAVAENIPIIVILDTSEGLRVMKIIVVSLTCP
jgi:hypothetical protein